MPAPPGGGSEQGLRSPRSNARANWCQKSFRIVFTNAPRSKALAPSVSRRIAIALWEASASSPPPAPVPSAAKSSSVVGFRSEGGNGGGGGGASASSRSSRRRSASMRRSCAAAGFSPSSSPLKLRAPRVTAIEGRGDRPPPSASTALRAARTAALTFGTVARSWRSAVTSSASASSRISSSTR